MDPNVALDRIREVLKEYRETGFDDADASKLFDNVEALVGWLDNGGWLPMRWQKGR